MTEAKPGESLAAAQLQAEIALTRDRVASEVDAIADKFTASNVKKELASTAADVALGAWRYVKARPLPLAVVGLGLVIVIWRARARRA